MSQFFGDSRIWRWCGEQLGQLFPKRDPRVAVNRKTRAEIVLGPGSVALYRHQSLNAPLHPDCKIADAVDVTDLVPVLKRNENVTLSLSDQTCFTRSINLPVRVLHNAGTIVDLDIERLTPFKKADVFSLWAPLSPPTSAHVDIGHAIIKKTAIQAIENQLQVISAKIVGIAIRPSKTAAWSNLLDRDGTEFGGKHQTQWAKIAVAACAVFVISVGALVITAISRVELARQDVEAGIEGFQGKAKNVRQKIDAANASNVRAQALLSLRQQSNSTIAVWEELSRTVPDGAWLQSLSITNGKAQIDGSADDAEKLIAILEASELFRNVQFTSPLFKNPNDQKVHFTIAFDLGSVDK
jgi:general secretion pathway protein L